MDDGVLSTVRRLPGVRTAYLITTTALPAHEPEPSATVKSLLSAVFGALGDASDAVGVGALSEAMFEGSTGSVVVRAIGEDIGAVVITEAKANLGLVRLELRKLPRQSR
jgi:predicted regulator of Ras-like GTPase activity (Roadblock/LC7/MglB family)